MGVTLFSVMARPGYFRLQGLRLITTMSTAALYVR